MTTRELCQKFIIVSAETCPWLRVQAQSDAWRDKVASEAVFWHDHITASRGWYQQFIAAWQALDPAFPYHAFKFDGLLSDWPTDTLIEALDVGCGPLIAFGTVWPGRHVRLTRADPLARVYARILRHLKLDSTALETVPVEAENLTTKFQPGTFHLVHSRNALDHSREPEAAISQMLQVCLPGGAVVLQHYQNEAKYCGYTGLHRWNFDVQGGYPVLWNKANHIFLDAAFPEARVEARLFDGKETHRKWVEVVLHKT